MVGADGHSPRAVGRYVLYEELASGGMATVHFGRLSGAVGFSRTVAIKRLHPHFAKDPEFVTMFLDEARLCGRIRHPNVVPTLDVVTLSGEVFIVMEYVAGEALSRLLKAASAKGLLPSPRVVATILSQVLHGLHAAHQARDEHGRDLGIVHRDVSPQNVLVGADGAARVLDFGVAKAAGRLQTTREGQVKGKIAYMPPEQLSGDAVTKQVDIYAASVVMWEALTGRRLFDGETEAIVLARALEGAVAPPSTFNPEVGPAVDELVLRGLARHPNQRFATAREMALAIEHSVGLASAYEVSEWVERVAGEELRCRAQTVAEIEMASIAPPPVIPRSVSSVSVVDTHSQVSSISVSRPAISIVPPKPTRTTRVIAALAVVGLVGGGLGVFAMQEASPGRRPEPKVFEGEPRRSVAMVGPEMARTRAAKETPSAQTGGAGPRVSPRPPAAPPHVAPAKKPSSNPCDPPFTLDPGTGRKVYKRECLR